MKRNCIDGTSKTGPHLPLYLIALLLAFVSLNAYAQSVHQLSYIGKWADQTLGTPARPWEVGGILAFTTTPNNQKHVYFSEKTAEPGTYDLHQDTPSKVARLGWPDEDLSQEAGSPTNYTAFDFPVGFSIANEQYVFYVPSDEHVHLLLYNNVGWTDQDVSAEGNGYLTLGYCVAFVTTPNDQIHLFYTTDGFDGEQAGEIHQLFFNGVNWADENLTAETGSTTSPNWPIAGLSNGNYQYVFYADNNLHLHEMYYNNLDWSDVDLSAQSGAPLAGYEGSAFLVPGTNTLELFYQATSHDIIQISSPDNSTWKWTDLTTLTHSPSPLPLDINALVSFVTTPNNQFHVYYKALLPTGAVHVNQLYLAGRIWSNEDLTTETSAPGANYFTGMSGFSMGNHQYIYYAGGQ